LAKVACGAFADISFGSGRKRRDFCGLCSARPEALTSLSLFDRETKLTFTDRDEVAVFQRMTPHAAAVHHDTVRAIQIFDDSVRWSCENHCVMTADELRVDLQIVIRRAAHRGFAA
jgi:hypothetical protein